ncbi:ABC-2 type transport system ATP-binding protein/lipopolysaccharide transport system ATP-binding protein [Rhizobiales bacterium GAS191]|jgi:ABC-type polysaccharide/polyol phosphate transport system ATPase subunit|nr:ABC-2 type transport system ATP-binding protein/lipopolysaccharide transport system ATP-binding protein [Rhizobiales bacterium GAS113]SED56036.1 ABC-2 type transport system ATP-binding protein/lipopolysaccharide transport system ATP-binding protein [Rhizobiales bacterium GAS191]SEE79318.1 ABC-2 type transport system ATP-binding protein/lipopolysaccharide transport system ATP-binding protein [Rhizobiales bacterium GAS188]
MARLILDKATLDVPLHDSRSHSLQIALAKFLRRDGGAGRSSGSLRLLDGVDLVLRDGDRLGLVGGNGAGKTTLLRLLAGVYEPTSGRIHRVGKIASYTDLTLGMDLESCGWTNITLRCVFLGLTFAEAQALSPRIAEFSELGEALSRPVRTYSHGMVMRLAVAVAAAVRTDVVIIDEMIGAVDGAFLNKARQWFDFARSSARILVMASHDMSILRDYCSTIAWLDSGRIIELGPADQVLPRYERMRGRWPRPLQAA